METKTADCRPHRSGFTANDPTAAIIERYRKLSPELRAAVVRALDHVEAGWRPVPDHATANPEERPADAISLMARGPRMAWLLADGTLSTGRRHEQASQTRKGAPLHPSTGLKVLALAAVLLAGCASSPTTSYIAQCERQLFREGITHPEGVPARLYCTDIALERRAATSLPR